MEKVLSRKEWRARHLGFLVLAFALHVGLLAIPLHRAAPRATEPGTLVVTFSHPPRPEPKQFSPPRGQQMNNGRGSELPAESRAARPPEAPAEARSPGDDTSFVPLTTARLLDQAAHMDWGVPDQPPRYIARSTGNELYQEFRRPLLPLQTNLFDRFILPREIEIVDRWLEPGGTHRVVLRTPTGDVLCGRQKSQDGFRPWLQTPMLFHLCGGGGTRTPR